MPEKFAYLFGNMLFLLLWLILYIHRKDLRREMIYMGIFVGLAGVLAERYWYTVDWWQPQTITNTRVGIEDFILGFSTGGITAVIFKELFSKASYRARETYNHWLNTIPVFVGVLIMFYLFNYLRLFSFYANLIGLGFIALSILLIRRDLIRESIMGGLLLVVVSLPVYWLIFWLCPSWRDNTWFSYSISGIYILGIPYEDLVWWFFVGINFAVVYDFINGLRLRRSPQSN